MRRDHLWLEKQLKFLLSKYFSDVKLTNPLEIRFGQEAKYRFGSIRLIRGTKSTRSTKSTKGVKRLSTFHFLRLRQNFAGRALSTSLLVPQKSIITITSMFAKTTVPVKVVQYTIGHELCHYAHGFSSTNRRLFKFPHHGGIVNRELTERGAHDLIIAYKKWLKVYRKKILVSRVKV